MPPRKWKGMKCSIAGCDRPAKIRSWCDTHYRRWKLKGDPLALKISSSLDTSAFIEKAIKCRDKECLIWPYGRSKYGYAAGGKQRGDAGLIHRLVCRAVNGDPPEDKPLATHSCGNGHLACVNGSHLVWGSSHDNAMDMYVHGTMKNLITSKLSEEDVLSIFRLKWSTEWGSRTRIAKQYGVTPCTIGNIWLGKIWAWLTSTIKP